MSSSLEIFFGIVSLHILYSSVIFHGLLQLVLGGFHSLYIVLYISINLCYFLNVLYKMLYITLLIQDALYRRKNDFYRYITDSPSTKI